MRARLAALVDVPLARRLLWHARRITGGAQRGFVRRALLGLLVVLLVAALLVTLVEKPKDSPAHFASSLWASFYWAVTSVLGSGDASYVTNPVSGVISWLMVLFGVAIVATLTGALVGVVIDILLKEGQGMGAAGYRDHVVVCGWNATARELVAEMRGDDYDVRVVLVHDVEKNPAGPDVYFVRGDATDAGELARAGIAEARAAVVFPADGSNEADMRSILTVMAIESMAPQVRTVVEVNNPAHVPHLERAHADEILVSSRLASHLLARSALYPGLTNVVADIVSGGEGSELYRVDLPAEYVGLSVDELSQRLRGDHRATLLAVTRGGRTEVNPPADFRLLPGDDAVVVAESLGTLAPLRVETGVPDRAVSLDDVAAGTEPQVRLA
ncbi:hypothetical protein GCM10027446_08670 [Angustibacter peucedani]